MKWQHHQQMMAQKKRSRVTDDAPTSSKNAAVESEASSSSAHETPAPEKFEFVPIPNDGTEQPVENKSGKGGKKTEKDAVNIEEPRPIEPSDEPEIKEKKQGPSKNKGGKQ